MGSNIGKASMGDLDLLAELFNDYRRFYGRADNLAKARQFIRARLEEGSSTLFIAKDPQGMALGFVQLYPGFCSVRAEPMLLLSDVFVTQHARCVGIGRKLLEAAKDHARRQGVSCMTLQTHKSNVRAQALYQSLGFVRDEAFYTYELELPGRLT
jgi:ribosomal protein S18 acetylase RimI-like enzyme